MDTYFTKSADHIRRCVLKRVCDELREGGWEQSTICPDRFHHPKFGTHDAFKAATLQHKEDLKKGRAIAVLSVFGLLFIVYIISMLT
jgi:hypothetical protein